MSFARLIVRLLTACAIFSLFGCAVVSETRTVKNQDGSVTTTDSKRLEYRPSLPYVYVAPQYPYNQWALPVWMNGVPVCRGGRARLINRRCYFY